MIEIKTFHLGDLQTNCFLVYDKDSKTGAVIDPGGNPLEVTEYCREHDIDVKLILATHGHFDHIGGVAGFKDAFDGALYCISSQDRLHYENMLVQAQVFGCVDVVKAPEPDIDLDGKPVISAGELKFEAVPTPGHSKGSVTFIIDNHLFVGDLIFQMSIGRTDMPGGDMLELLSSVNTEIFTREGSDIIYPGHGPLTTVDDEKMGNPFFK